MLTFHFTAIINALPIDADKRRIERITGTLEAEGHASAKKSELARFVTNR